MKNKQIIPYILLVISTLTALYFYNKNNTITKKFEETLTVKKLLMSTLEVRNNVLNADSLLIKGKYNQALKLYDENLANKKQFNKEHKLKIALTNKLQNLGVNISSFKEATIKAKNDSIKNENLKFESRDFKAYSREIDSLNFALKKSKVQLSRTRKQLQESSLGAYLTFKSKKGNVINYVGKVKNQKANGYGIAILDSGGRYEGDWKDNLRNGEGVYFWKDGEYYKGSYVNDERNGIGTYFWPNGEKYVGNWKNNKRNGTGSFYNKKGVVVTSGTWKDDKLIK